LVPTTIQRLQPNKTPMAKSTRSKVKRSFRKAKRDDSIFAVTHAARLERLSQKLAAIARPAALKTPEQDEKGEPVDEPEGLGEGRAELIEVDALPKVSTHGRWLNRRQEWRASRGLPTRRKVGTLNRQAAPVAVRHSGRPKRRR